MRVEPVTPDHLPAVRAAYADARGIQRAQGGVLWPTFPDTAPDAAILAEVGAGRLLRVLERDALVGVFSVAYEDRAIWGEHERGAHVYVHRVARAAT